MLPPYSVRLLQHDPEWADRAEREVARILEAAAPVITQVEHVGSTSIPGIAAKPIVDLMAVATNLDELDNIRPTLEALGYAWHGEYGLEGRRFCTLTDAASGLRMFHLHCYAEGDHSIRRHLAFRDFMRAHSEKAQEYEEMKRCCAAKHPDDSNAYTACKDKWIKQVEAEALKHY